MVSKRRKSSKNQKVTNTRSIRYSVRKLSDEEIKLFLEVLSALMAAVPAPKDARKRYLKEVENRLRNNGVDFLSKSRVFPTYGLKLLGRDTTGFPIKGFKRAEDKIYPRLFAWYWAELERLSQLRSPKMHDVKRAQRVLVVLSFAKMVKASTVNQIKKSLIDFENRVTVKGAQDSEKSSHETDPKDPSPTEEKTLVEDKKSLKETLGFISDLDSLPQYVDFGSLSTKPSSLKETPAMPEWFRARFIKVCLKRDGTTYLYVPTFGFKPPPYGKVHVLTEAAGKLRIIVPYNSPFVHSTGLFRRCRTILNEMSGDCSTDQSKGHRFIKKVTSPLTRKGDGDFIISADLESFSDNTDTAALGFGLSQLGLTGLDRYLFNLPVTMPNGKEIIPSKLLMGLKGCFELSSVLHHYAVKHANINRYALCGDDLVYVGKLDPYNEQIKSLGWSINRSKTVISKTAAVFCGEYYWFGHRVSPKIPKVHSIYINGKLRKAAVLFSTIRDSISSLNTIYTRSWVARIVGPFIVRLRRRWKGVVIPQLPAKMRGLGMKPHGGKGLNDLLSNKCILRVALMAIGVDHPPLSRTRWLGLPIQLNPEEIQPEFPGIPSLLKKGAIDLSVPVKRPSLAKDVGSLELYQAYEWYYDSVRLSPDDFKMKITDDDAA